MTKSDTPWVFLDHTADIRMEVHGETLEDLFENAARGLTQLLAHDVRDPAVVEREVTLEALALEDLIVDWLRELLYLRQTKDFVFVGLQIHALSGEQFSARVHGRQAGPDDEPDIEIKAVTYHGISIEKTPDGYTTRIVFDI